MANSDKTRSVNTCIALAPLQHACGGHHPADCVAHMEGHLEHLPDLDKTHSVNTRIALSRHACSGHHPTYCGTHIEGH